MESITAVALTSFRTPPAVSLVLPKFEALYENRSMFGSFELIKLNTIHQSDQNVNAIMVNGLRQDINCPAIICKALPMY